MPISPERTATVRNRIAVLCLLWEPFHRSRFVNFSFHRQRAKAPISPECNLASNKLQLYSKENMVSAVLMAVHD